MNNRGDGGPAFPEAIAVGPSGDVYPGFSGMSLRDWFAGQAAAAEISAWENSTEGHEANIARRAYALADAMLEARK